MLGFVVFMRIFILMGGFERDGESGRLGRWLMK